MVLSEAGKDRSGGGNAGFFHIDRRTWKILCSLRGPETINLATTYLTIACGTGRGNVVSKWSAQAAETYTGLHSSRAKTAICALIEASFLCRGDKWSRTRPVYELQFFDKVYEAARNRALNDASSRSVIDRVMKGKKLSPGELRQKARLSLDGVLRSDGSTYDEVDTRQDSNENLIWIPNSLVMGTVQGEASPVKRLRSSGDLWALRLLIDLYHSQNLSADGGISRLVLRRDYVRKRYGQRGRHVIWGFMPSKDQAGCQPSTQAFWDFSALDVHCHTSTYGPDQPSSASR
jgi:hypothetical protein